MGGLSLGHWAIVLLVVVLLFGRGRVSETMEDFGKGIRNFRRGLSGDEASAGNAQPIESVERIEVTQDPANFPPDQV